MIPYLSENDARDAIVDVGKRIYQSGFVAANDGNISCRIAENCILVTPTNVSKGFMTREMIVKMDLDGCVIGPGKPSSEVKMHLRAYQENAQLRGVVHAHPPVSTGFSIVGMEMDRPLVAEGVLVTGIIRIAPYAKPGTYEVPDSIAPYVNTHHGVLLENHGALTWGSDLYQALYRMEAMEHQAKITLYASALAKLYDRQIRYLNREELQGLVEIRSGMGITTGGDFVDGRYMAE